MQAANVYIYDAVFWRLKTSFDRLFREFLGSVLAAMENYQRTSKTKTLVGWICIMWWGASGGVYKKSVAVHSHLSLDLKFRIKASQAASTLKPV
jgi:hypothetical protein